MIEPKLYLNPTKNLIDPKFYMNRTNNLINILTGMQINDICFFARLVVSHRVCEVVSILTVINGGCFVCLSLDCIYFLVVFLYVT
jgi:hypothetical protein